MEVTGGEMAEPELVMVAAVAVGVYWEPEVMPLE